MSIGEHHQAARQEAVTLLSRREYSVRELQQKLAAHPAETVDEVIESLQSQGLQSDQRFAEVWVRHRLLSGYGPLKLQAELRQKGIAGELIQHCLQSDAIDWFEQAVQVFQRKFGRRPARDVKEKARQMRFLQYRGFTGDQIRHALQSDS